MLGVISRTLVLLVLGSALGFVFNWVRPSGVPLHPVEKVAVCEAAQPDDLVVMAPDDAAALCEQLGAIVLDVRSEEDYAKGHVADAIHLPCRDNPLAGDISGLLATANLILIYGESTEDARPVAQSLVQRRYQNVRILEGGYAAWEAAGQGCVSGPCEDCAGGPQ